MPTTRAAVLTLGTVLVVWAIPAGAVLGIPDFLEFGDCANITLMEDFDTIKYTGLWFDIQSVPNQYQHTKKCVTQNYTWTGEFMNVATRGLTNEGQKVRQAAQMHVEKTAVSTPHPAYMTVDAAGVPAAPYQIIATDYRTYSCVYSCLEYFGFRAEFAWVFGRTPTLPDPTVQICHTTFTNMGVNSKKMEKIVQGEECPYNEKIEEMLDTSRAHMASILGEEVITSISTSTAATSTFLPTARKLPPAEVPVPVSPVRTTTTSRPMDDIHKEVGGNNPSKADSAHNPSSVSESRATVDHPPEAVDHSLASRNPAAPLALALAPLMLALMLH